MKQYCTGYIHFDSSPIVEKIEWEINKIETFGINNDDDDGDDGKRSDDEDDHDDDANDDDDDADERKWL